MPAAASFLVRLSLLSTFFAVAALPAVATTLDAVDRGWYDSGGGKDPNNDNYFAGQGQNVAPMRDYFVFDLSGVGETIVAAELQLLLPQPGFNQSFASDTGVETFAVYDYTGSIGDLTSGANGLASYADLGSGIFYGSVDVTVADVGTVVTVGLNDAALAAINAGSGLFAVGGALTTLDNDPTNAEWVFAQTENMPLGTTKLSLTPVPEPSAAALLFVGTLLVARSVRRPRGA